MQNGRVDATADLVAPVSCEDLFAELTVLGRYPAWLDIVSRAQPAGVDDDGLPVWTVDLRGKVGPFARSKRLRMVRTVLDPPRAVRFERRELDGRQHSPWVLDAQVVPHERGSRLTMNMHYGGGMFGGVLERVLRDEIERSRPRLLALLASPDR